MFDHHIIALFVPFHSIPFIVLTRDTYNLMMTQDGQKPIPLRENHPVGTTFVNTREPRPKGIILFAPTLYY
jgi:hypothetical protein